MKKRRGILKLSGNHRYTDTFQGTVAPNMCTPICRKNGQKTFLTLANNEWAKSYNTERKTLKYEFTIIDNN